MKKKLFSSVIFAALCFGLCIGSAKITPAYASQQPKIETSVIGSSSRILLGKQPYYILKSNGELWCYIMDRNVSETFIPKLVLKDVVAISEEEDQLGTWSVILALKKDGALYQVKFFEFYGAYEDSPYAELLAENVTEISQNSYLKENGELYSLSRSVGVDMQTSTKFVANNVMSFAGNGPAMRNPANRAYDNNGLLVYITKDHVLHYGTSEEILEGFQKVYYHEGAYFAVTDDNDLYGWGENTRGQAGNSFHYDDYLPVTMVPGGAEVDSIKVLAYTVKPELIFENIKEMYFEKNCIYARDEKGDLWQWGDAPIGFYAPVRNNTYYMNEAVPPEQKYCVPRRSEKAQPEYKNLNNIHFGADGSLYITYLDVTEKLVQFPVRRVDIMYAKDNS